MHVERSRRFDRPPSVVFRSIAHDHVRDHPRWDPWMELWPIDSRATFEPTDDGGTLVTISVEMPDEVTAFDPAFLERSLRNMQELVERHT